MTDNASMKLECISNLCIGNAVMSIVLIIKLICCNGGIKMKKTDFHGESVKTLFCLN